MKFLILSENSRGEYLHYYYRNPAANELRQRIELAGHQATIIEWIRNWEKKDLWTAIINYFQNESQPVIAISSTFDLYNDDLIYLKDILIEAKKQLPNLKIIRGGNRVFIPDKEYDGLIDVYFLGRSMGIFDDWIKNKDITKYIVSHNPLILNNKNVDVTIENPLTPVLYKDDCLNKHDHLGFEIAIGCRFNCSFCNYELRGSKVVQLNSVKKLYNFFNEAYNEYGIRHFYSIDDTLNESIEKLEILNEAISKLSYHPQITAWLRADLLNKPEQRNLIKSINFDAIWFGIESFNPNASKHVRKKNTMDHLFDSLSFVRDNCPDTFTTGSFIIGLNGDNFESIEQGFDKVVQEKLLSSIQMYWLSIYPKSQIQDPSIANEIELNPEKFGYKVFENATSDPVYSVNHIIWESDWTDNIKAQKMCTYFGEKYKDKILFLTHSECSSYRAMNLLKPRQLIHPGIVKHRATILSNMYKNIYVANKKKQFNIP